MNPLLERGNTRLAPLDTVEPDCWRKNESVQWDSRIHTTITHKSEFPEKVARLFNSPLYSRETVEYIIEAVKAKTRKEVLDNYLESMRTIFESSETMTWADFEKLTEELRRMAESTMEGEK